MRIDNVVWQKTKITRIEGFLSDEGDSLIFTKYKGGYKDDTKVLFTKGELKFNRFLDSTMGKLQPEKEMFRISKKAITELNIMKIDPTTTGGRTYYSVYATFKNNNVDYSLTHVSGSQEETDKLATILSKEV